MPCPVVPASRSRHRATISTNRLDGCTPRGSNTRPRCGRTPTARKQHILAG